MIHLTILNLQQTIFDGQIESLTLPGEQGELTVLTDHVAIVTAIKGGTIRADQKYFESKGGGIFEFNNNAATILL